MQRLQVIPWQDDRPPQEPELRARMQREGLMPYAWSNEAGDRYAPHTHGYEKVLYCVRGSIRFILHDQPAPGREDFVDLAPGDCMILPAGIRHSAEVGPHGVTCLESPRY